jgi:prepilin peptidase CpaA
MPSELLSYGLLAGLAIALAIAAWTDLRSRTIANWLNAAVALAAPLFWATSGLSLFEAGLQVALALVVFLILLVLFSTGLMGGGDVKLLTALALWIDPVTFVKLLVWMSIAGGLLTAVCFVWHRVKKHEGRIAVPYGIAISVAGLWVLADNYLPALRSASQLG